MSRANKEFIGEAVSWTGTSICLMFYVTLIVLSCRWSIVVLAMSGLTFLCLLCDWRMFAILTSTLTHTYSHAITKTLTQGYHMAGALHLKPKQSQQQQNQCLSLAENWADINYTFEPGLNSMQACQLAL